MNALPAHWRARLALQFRHEGDRTRLTARRHEGPLLVQRPFHPEGAVCHVYLIHPPGGIVGGDELVLQAEVAPQAHALLTTPAATRFYRAGPHPRATLQQDLIARDGCIEWLPQETLLFDGARAATFTHVDLQGASRFIGWEVVCLGRPACAERFTQGSLRQTFSLSHDGTPLLHDRLRVEGDSPALQAGWGFGGAPACGSLAAFPGDAALLPALRAVHTGGVESALTFVDGVLLCRATGFEGDAVRRHFTSLWTLLRPALLGRPACPPRIWAT